MSVQTCLQWLRSIPVTLAITAIALFVYGWSPLAPKLEIHLQQPGSIGLLQVVGCHLLHWSGEHLFWDLIMFVVLGAICERWLPQAFSLTLTICALAIPLTVCWAHPQIDTYRGLSGLDTAIFSLLVTALWLHALLTRDTQQMVVFGLLLIALWGKIIVEFQSGQVLFVQQVDFKPLPIAHASGALLGSVVALWRSTDE